MRSVFDSANFRAECIAKYETASQMQKVALVILFLDDLRSTPTVVLPHIDFTQRWKGLFGTP
jgi:hypothetical protein